MSSSNFHSLEEPKEEPPEEEEVMEVPEDQPDLQPEHVPDEESDKKLECEGQNWIDDVIKLFTVPEQKRHLYDDTGLVSNEESMERINYLLLLFSCLLFLVSITLLSTMEITIVPKTISNYKKLTARVPHIYIINPQPEFVCLFVRTDISGTP